MDTEKMIRELRRLEEKHKNDRVDTFENNWSAMCHDVANRLEELSKHENNLTKLNDTLDSLIDIAHETYMSTKESDTENRARLDAQIQAYWNVKNVVENMLAL